MEIKTVSRTYQLTVSEVELKVIIAALGRTSSENKLLHDQLCEMYQKLTNEANISTSDYIEYFNGHGIHLLDVPYWRDNDKS